MTGLKRQRRTFLLPSAATKRPVKPEVREAFEPRLRFLKLRYSDSHGLFRPEGPLLPAQAVRPGCW